MALPFSISDKCLNLCSGVCAAKMPEMTSFKVFGVDDVAEESVLFVFDPVLFLLFVDDEEEALRLGKSCRAESAFRVVFRRVFCKVEDRTFSEDFDCFFEADPVFLLVEIRFVVVPAIVGHLLSSSIGRYRKGMTPRRGLQEESSHPCQLGCA